MAALRLLDAVALMQSLPDNGKVTIRTTRSDGKVKEGHFTLVPYLKSETK